MAYSSTKQPVVQHDPQLADRMRVERESHERQREIERERQSDPERERQQLQRDWTSFFGS